jgi:hypothetical protein
MRAIILDGQLPIEGTALQDGKPGDCFYPRRESIRKGLLLIEKNEDQ